MIEYTVKVETDGTQSWYLNGQLHREDGPAIVGEDGCHYWYLNGQLHREDGPAIVGADGGCSWWLNGKIHREDGPAIVCADGRCSWWLNGEKLTKEEYKQTRTKEMTVKEICQKLGYNVKIIASKKS